jgi:hypothetical protein
LPGARPYRGQLGARQVSTALVDRPDKAPFAAGGMPISWARAWFGGAETGPSGQRCRPFRRVVAALGGWISPATFQAILLAKARGAVRMPRTTQAAGVKAPRLYAMAKRLPAEDKEGTLRCHSGGIGQADVNQPGGSAPKASMQLHLRLPAVRHHPHQRSPQHRRMPMQRCLMHLIK